MNLDEENTIKISEEQAEEIFSDKGESLMIAKKTVFCHNCFPQNHKSVEMIIDKYYVNDLYDVILKGRCSLCSNPVGRYIESSEIPSMAKRAKKLCSNELIIKRKEEYGIK